jgi:hypothetical protein
VITLVLCALCIINFFTKQVATISGVSFTIIFFLAFLVSERIAHEGKAHSGGHVELDHFNLEPGSDLNPTLVGVRPGNVLVMVRDYNGMYGLSEALRQVNTHAQDIAVMHLRILARAASGDSDLDAAQLFSSKEQELCTRALNLAEKSGKTIHLAIASATEKWDGILRAAQSLQSSTIVLGLSPWRSVTEEARVAGMAWERLPDPKPHLTLEIYSPQRLGEPHNFYLGPHSPAMTAIELDLLHRLWLDFSEAVPEELHHRDVIHFALNELATEAKSERRAEVIERLREHLLQIKDRRVLAQEGTGEHEAEKVSK